MNSPLRGHRRVRGLLAVASSIVTSVAQAQDLASQGSSLDGVGWAGFADGAFLLHALGVMVLATALGAAIAFHPLRRKRVDSLEEADVPKVYLVYAVVGAVIGLMVVEYGMVVGFVVFGIGGLFRFRTALASPAGTGRLILVTLVGLSCGLDLPHLGVLATAFGFALVSMLDRWLVCEVEVKGLDADRLVAAAGAYRTIIERRGGEVIRESKSFSRSRARFLFRAPYRFDLDALEQAFDEMDPSVQGSVDWTVD